MLLIALTKFGESLAQTGAVAGGATAWGASLGLIAGAIAVDTGFKADRWALATKGGTLGALFGVSFGVWELIA